MAPREYYKNQNSRQSMLAAKSRKSC